MLLWGAGGAYTMSLYEESLSPSQGDATVAKKDNAFRCKDHRVVLKGALMDPACKMADIAVQSCHACLQ